MVHASQLAVSLEQDIWFMLSAGALPALFIITGKVADFRQPEIKMPDFGWLRNLKDEAAENRFNM